MLYFHYTRFEYEYKCEAPQSIGDFSYWTYCFNNNYYEYESKHK